MVRTNIQMIHPAKIAKFGYPGCKTVRGVVNFCEQNKRSINCVWWRKDNQRVLMVDPNSFQKTWKKVYDQKTQSPTYRSKSTGRKQTRGSRTQRRTQTPKQYRRRTYRRAA
ncbi:MAG: hypothetical protein GF355_02985 [Candidatus Eisenbacteria bacterium]|nr:hypothetical protein [Candidatus Eisenbacteria bacterium]